MDPLSTQLPLPFKRVIKHARLRHVPKGQILLYGGEDFDDVYVLKSGVVKLLDIDASGNEKVLHLIKSPTLMPFAYFDGAAGPLHWLYTALTDCEVYVLPVKEMQKAERRDYALARQLIHDFYTNVHELLVRLGSLDRSNTNEKVSAVLKFLAVCHSTQTGDSWWRVDFPTSHQLLADMTGITRESATIAMKKMQMKGIIRSSKLSILEINLAKLAANLT